MILTTSFPKTNPISLTLSHLLLTSSTFSQEFFFNQYTHVSGFVIISAPPQLVPPSLDTDKASPFTSPSHFLLTTYIHLRFLNSSQTSVPLPEILSTFQLPNLTPRRFATFSSRSFNPEILSTLCPFKGCRGPGTKVFFCIFIRFSWSFLFYGRMPLVTPTTVISRGPSSLCLKRHTPLPKCRWRHFTAWKWRLKRRCFDNALGINEHFRQIQ